MGNSLWKFSFLWLLSCIKWLFVHDNGNLSGCFACDPSVLHRVGHVLLQLNQVESRRTRRCIVADDLFQLSKVPLQKTVSVVSRVTKNLKGCKLHLQLFFYSLLSSCWSSWSKISTRCHCCPFSFMVKDFY